MDMFQERTKVIRWKMHWLPRGGCKTL